MLFVWTNVALVALTWRATPWIAPPGGPWLRATVALGTAMAVAIGLTLGLGVVGALFPWPLAGAVTALLVAVAAAERAARSRGLAPHPAEEAGPASDRGPEAAVGVALLGASAALFAWRTAWVRTGFCFDDVVYHAAIPATWVQDGRIAHSALSYQTYYAFDAELLATWFMVPLQATTHAGLAPLLFAALLVCASLAVAETARIPLAPVFALLGAMFASGRMLYFARTFSSTDLALASWVLVACALTAQPRSGRTAVLAGLAAGAAVGTKVSAGGPVLFLALWWAWSERRRPLLPLAFVLATLPLGAWWYVQNLVATGNPVFPAAMGPFDGPLDRATQRRTSLLWFLQTEGTRMGFWRELMTKRLNWPLGLGLPAMAGLGAGVLAARLPGRRAAALVAGAALVFLVLHPLQPFSGTINRPGTGLHAMVRYGTLPFAFGLPLLASLASPRDRTDKALVALAGVGWLLALTEEAWPRAAELGVLGGGALLAGVALRVPRWPAGLVPALLVAGLIGIQVRADAKARNTWDAVETFSRRSRLHAPAWRALDALPDGRSVAWIADLPPSHAFNLGLMGSRLQHRVVPVGFDGVPASALHVAWRGDAGGSWWDAFEHAPRDLADRPVLDALLAGPADVLVLSRCQQRDGGPWPSPRSALVAEAVGSRLHGDRCVEIWDLADVRARAQDE